MFLILGKEFESTVWLIEKTGLFWLQILIIGFGVMFLAHRTLISTCELEMFHVE